METIIAGDYSVYAKIIAYILSILVPALVGVLVAYFNKKYGIEKINEFQAKLAAYEEIGKLACRMAEEKYNELGGPVKLEKAIELASAELVKMGVKMTPEEIDALIHASLRKLRDELGDAWENPSTKSYKY